jgi:hypothetical protein
MTHENKQKFTQNPLPEESTLKLRDVLHRITLLCKTRGVCSKDLPTLTIIYQVIFKYSYEDFDKLHRGIVTVPQFHRRFPFPQFTHDEITLLAERWMLRLSRLK